MKTNPFQPALPRLPGIPPWASFVLLFVLVVLAFSPSLGFGFINYDDPHYITENLHVNTGLGLSNLKWALTSTGDTNLWSPLTFVSHQLDVSLFGLNPTWHHAVNVLWHALAASFLFLVAQNLTKSLRWSFFIAFLWAIHPEKIQSVAWLSERKDVLSGALVLASLYLFSEWKLKAAKVPALYLSSLILFGLALLAKPSVVPLPLILFLLFYLDLKRPLPSALASLRPLTPFFVASLLAAGATLYFQSADVGADLSIGQKLVNIVVGYVFYLHRFLWPAPAQIWFDPPDSLWPFVISLGVLGVFASAVIWFGRKEKLILIGIAIYTIMWLPISGLVSVSYYFVTARYSYLPQIGLILILVGLAKLISRKISNPVPASIVLASFTILLLFLQQKQLPHWKNNETLFSHEMAINPTSLLAPIHYAEVFSDSDPEKALIYYTMAHQNDPQAGVALTKMGMMQVRLNRPDEALKNFLQATQVNTPVPENWTALLLLQVELGQYDQAEQTVKQGLERYPKNWEIIMNSGNFYLLVRKQPSEALPLFLKAHALQPNDPRASKACATTYRALGEPAKAEALESSF